MNRLIDELSNYELGYIAGLKAYASWQDGKFYVTPSMTLNSAVRIFTKTGGWDFSDQEIDLLCEVVPKKDEVEDAAEKIIKDFEQRIAEFIKTTKNTVAPQVKEKLEAAFSRAKTTGMALLEEARKIVHEATKPKDEANKK